MTSLSTNHVSVCTHLFTGRSVIQDNTGILWDGSEACEQIDALVKGLMDAVGLTKNVAVLRRWISTEPEISLLILEFKGCTHWYGSEFYVKSHKVQVACKQVIGNLNDSIWELGYSFLENWGNMMTLGTKDMCQDAINMASKECMSGTYSLYRNPEE